MKKVFLLAAMFLAMGSQVAHASLITNWETNPITVGDKLYTYVAATPGLESVASVDATEVAGVHSFNLSNLNGITANGNYLKYHIHVTDPFNSFLFNIVSENAVFGDTVAGSTTTVYSDAAFSNLVNTTILKGTQAGGLFNTAGLKDLYIQTLITNVSASHKIANVTFDVTQSNAVPEPSTYALLCISLGVVGFARKKMKNQQ